MNLGKGLIICVSDGKLEAKQKGLMIDLEVKTTEALSPYRQPSTMRSAIPHSRHLYLPDEKADVPLSP
jgi:hypothetical protein